MEHLTKFRCIERLFVIAGNASDAESLELTV